jgi:GlcNAc-P-P-Und epimerase
VTSGHNIIVFGGTGFIGTHLTQHLLRTNPAAQILLVDVRPPRNESYTSALQEGLSSGRVRYAEWDIRKPVTASLLNERPDIIVNLAAVHREPGHKPEEYFETNILGAENVCAYAHATECDRIIFTSSISPYGPTENRRDEDSLPVPESPYGSSKLAAEKIHIGWQKARQGRKLLILRPGVVFGPGEGGNVTRLVKSLVRGYFVYMGNKSTRKAGGYVKELCKVLDFGLERQNSLHLDVLVLNFSMEPTPALQEYVKAISKVAGIRRTPFTVPRPLIMAVSHTANAIATLFGRSTQFNPKRVRKLFRSTYIRPSKLVELGYNWSFTMEDAFADWKRDCPSDFGLD